MWGEAKVNALGCASQHPPNQTGWKHAQAQSSVRAENVLGMSEMFKSAPITA